MELIPESKDWHRLWSVRLSALAAFFGWMEIILPAWEGIIPDGVLGVLSAIAISAAPFARMVKQALPHE